MREPWRQRLGRLLCCGAQAGAGEEATRTPLAPPPLADPATAAAGSQLVRVPAPPKLCIRTRLPGDADDACVSARSDARTDATWHSCEDLSHAFFSDESSLGGDAFRRSSAGWSICSAELPSHSTSPRGGERSRPPSGTLTRPDTGSSDPTHPDDLLGGPACVGTQHAGSAARDAASSCRTVAPDAVRLIDWQQRARPDAAAVKPEEPPTAALQQWQELWPRYLQLMEDELRWLDADGWLRSACERCGLTFDAAAAALPAVAPQLREHAESMQGLAAFRAALEQTDGYTQCSGGSLQVGGDESGLQVEGTGTRA